MNRSLVATLAAVALLVAVALYAGAPAPRAAVPSDKAACIVHEVFVQPYLYTEEFLVRRDARDVVTGTTFSLGDQIYPDLDAALEGAAVWLKAGCRSVGGDG